MYFHFSIVPETPYEKGGKFDWENIDKPLNAQREDVHVVDAGLSINIPVACVLRQHRNVDLLISFDFTGRKSDYVAPFQVNYLICL